MTIHPWSSFVEKDDGSLQSHCQTNLVIVVRDLSLLFSHFINYYFSDMSLRLLRKSSKICPSNL